ncbi:MAG TPA: TldD/PmbA family protein [Nitrososphaerales archaeon]|nr:TldD/PmbA family protein [Nitrososphaerales archaeon]
MDLEALNEKTMTAVKKLGVDDAVVLSAAGKERMIRFANNSVTVVKHVEETELEVYMAKDRRRAIAATSNLEEASIQKFVSDLFRSLQGLPKGEYVPLPKNPDTFGPSRSLDRKLEDVGESLPELTRRAIDASLEAGGKRSAGVIDASKTTVAILTSAGTKGIDSSSTIDLNIRSFGENESSGHGLSCSSTLSGFDPEAAGRTAGEHAKMMEAASEADAGQYQVLLSPTVASNLVGGVVSAASAFSVDAGISYLAEKLGKKVAASSFNLTDRGVIEGGLGGRGFDDEGIPTKATPIVESGVLKSYLHNLTTSAKWKTETTGNAGLVTPRPWNIEIGAGDGAYDEMVKEMRRGIILTSNWYTRYKNFRTGEFSTVPRDGAYLVEAGEVKRPLKGMRVSDDLQRMLSSVQMLSKKRDWIEWWEVHTPTLCPWILVDGMRITRAYD